MENKAGIWVKASERLPLAYAKYLTRYPMIKQEWKALTPNEIQQERYAGYDIEWLDEQPVLQENGRVAELEKEVERLRGLIEKAFDDGFTYGYVPGNHPLETAKYWEQFKTENNL